MKQLRALLVILVLPIALSLAALTLSSCADEGSSGNPNSDVIGDVATDGSTDGTGNCGTSCGGTCCGGICVDLTNDINNCGACGNACPTSQVCSQGACSGSCAGGQSICDQRCTDTGSDPENCGSCGSACNPGQTCGGGVCVCAAGQNDCDGDPSNGCEVAGSCGCPQDETRECYDGNPATQNQGECRSGIQVCDGTSWGSCDGQVTPVAEICGNGLDDDCDGDIDENPDEDGDGYGACGGDCCDSMAQGCALDPSLVNPGAFDFDGNSLDDDCDGTIDNAPQTACSGSPITSGVSGQDLAQAMDLCTFTNSDPDRWGVISAELLRANGSGSPDDVQVGVLGALGGVVSPQASATQAVLSSGTARGPGDPGYQNPLSDSYGQLNSVSAPSVYLSQHGGALQTAPGCPNGDSDVNDSVLLRLRIRVPTNAQGFSFNHRFFSAEYPDWLCTEFNDFFLALLDSQHPDIPADRNISFDADGNPVSVNNAFFTTCEAVNCGYFGFQGTDLNFDGCPDSLACNSSNQCESSFGACPDGAAEVAAYTSDTSESGGTSWLTTQSPVVPGEEITLEFYIWDTSDELLDSLVLLDNFEWLIEPTEVGTFN